MSSSLVKFENSGILRMIERLSILDPNNGIINHTDDIYIASFMGSLMHYAEGAYDDSFAKTVAGNALNGDGIEVLSVTRSENIGIYSIELTAPFETEIVTIRIPHGAYD